jgi:hypothetical protein
VRLPILSEFDTFDAPPPSSNCQWKTWEPETSESSEAYIRLPAEDTSKRQERTGTAKPSQSDTSPSPSPPPPLKKSKPPLPSSPTTLSLPQPLSSPTAEPAHQKGPLGGTTTVPPLSPPSEMLLTQLRRKVPPLPSGKVLKKPNENGLTSSLARPTSGTSQSGDMADVSPASQPCAQGMMLPAMSPPWPAV